MALNYGELTHLEARFPNFKIIQWDKEDIRDKPATTTTEKSGYFTAKGKLKEEGQLDDYYDKIKTLHEYFSRNV